MYGQFTQARIAAVAAVVPQKVVRVRDIAAALGVGEGKIAGFERLVGVLEHRQIAEGFTGSDLAAEAVTALLEETGLAKNDLDLLLVVTQTPDYKMPGNANVLHQRLGLGDETLALSITEACAGYVLGLFQAFSFLEAPSVRRIILVAGDAITQQVYRRDISTAPLFGDAVTATLIEKSPQGAAPSYFHMCARGEGYKSLYIPRGAARTGGSEEEETRPDGSFYSNSHIVMDGMPVFLFASEVVPKNILSLLTFSGKTVEDVDYFIPHQANKQIIDNIATKIRMDPQKVLQKSLPLFGNTSSASIAVELCASFGVRQGGVSGRCLLSGYGAGLSWSSAYMDLNDVRCRLLVSKVC